MLNKCVIDITCRSKTTWIVIAWFKSWFLLLDLNHWFMFKNKNHWFNSINPVRNISGILGSPTWKLMRTNRHFFSPFTWFFLLLWAKTRALLRMHRIFTIYSHALFFCTMWKQHYLCTHRHFFSPLPAFFSCTTWASGN